MRLNLRNQRLGLKLAVNRQARAGGSVWSPADLNGIYAAYDFTDESKLWQNSARSTPVTALGQPIGAVDDISGNNRHAVQANDASIPSWCGVPATYGSDLVTNGGFATDSDWTKGTGVTIGSGVATFTSVAGNTVGLSQPISVTAGKLYEITFTISARTGGGVAARFSGGTTVSSVSRSANGTFTQHLRAITGNTTLEIFTAGTTTLSIDNLIVREVLTASGNNGAILARLSALLLEAGSTTLSTPVYIAGVFHRFEAAAAGIASFGAAASQYYRIIHNTTARASANSVITGPGTVSADSANNAVPLGEARVLEAIFQSGTQLISTNGTDVPAVNTITTESFTAKSGWYGIASSTGVTLPVVCYGLIFSTAVPTSEERALVRAWLAERGGVTL